MTGMIRKLISLTPIGALAALAAVPSAASAHGFHIDFRIVPPAVVVETPAPAPVYVDREVRVWVAPVYRTVCDRVWVPDQFEDREVVFYHRGWRHVHHEQVLIVPGHYEDVNRQALVTPGHYETHIERVLVN